MSCPFAQPYMCVCVCEIDLKGLLRVLDKWLEGRDFIANTTIFPWIHSAKEMYNNTNKL